ncbi:sulfatase [Flavobacterium sp. L1I52]|uniref:Sulfatase n=1 Tax=Flavobacterium pokkalii TaxID=1940408 RepID=A0ABR7UQ49_9FLAO|nr:sulfatase [Flavobacterium pokkalii]MBD0724737.1 sulfatase [Flavobacterium pokkalii]
MKTAFKIILASLSLIVLHSCNAPKKKPSTVNAKAPNVLIIVTDELRAQATSYAGDENIKTPNLDRLASMSVNFKNAVSGMPVCTPFRGSLMTGQRPITNGMFMNDVQLDTTAVTMGNIYAKAGYDTGYIGKWHMDGHGRTKFIPPGSRRQGFQFWQANECTHNYNRSVYYDNNDPTPRTWGDYDTFAQTDAAIAYMDSKKNGVNPFLLVLAWGTPHSPYNTAPEKYKKMFNPNDIKLRPNVPKGKEEAAKEELAGYYAHIAALDEMMGKLLDNLKASNQLDNTIIVFTSDHGNMSGSHRQSYKQQPYAESVKVPMLFYVPKGFGIKAGDRSAMLNSEDILPTLLGLCNISIPKSVEGINYTAYMQGKGNLKVGEETIITCVQPFGQWNRKKGGKEYRGLVTERYTYVKDLNGPWLFFDNEKDPYQLKNLVNNPNYKMIQDDLEKRLLKRLQDNKDEFLPGMEYVKKWGYTLDDSGTVPFK